jgi:hypothetical protein
VQLTKSVAIELAHKSDYHPAQTNLVFLDHPYFDPRVVRALRPEALDMAVVT